MTASLLRPLAWVALQALLLLLGVLSAAWNLVALLLYPLLPRDAGRRLGRVVIAHGYRLYWWLAERVGLMRLDTGALDALATERGLIVVANHPSMLDAMLLVARLPRSACVMKASLMLNPFLAAGARLARYICNDSPMGLVRLSVDELQAGGQLVMFPEGTRSARGGLQPFKPGFALIAQRARAPVQAVFIETDSPYLGKGWPLWRLPPLPIVFGVRLGRRFAPQDDAQALAAQVREHIAAGLRRPGAAPA